MLGLEGKSSEEKPLILKQQIEAGTKVLLCLDYSVSNITFSCGRIDQIPEIFLIQLNNNLWRELAIKIDSSFRKTNYKLGFEYLNKDHTQNSITLQLRVDVTIKETKTASELQSDQGRVCEELSIIVENFMARIAREQPVLFKGIQTIVWFAELPAPETVVEDDVIWDAVPLPNLTKSSKEYITLQKIELPSELSASPQLGDRKRKSENNGHSDSNIKKKKAEDDQSLSNIERSTPTVGREHSSPAMFRLPSSPLDEQAQTVLQQQARAEKK